MPSAEIPAQYRKSSRHTLNVKIEKVTECLFRRVDGLSLAVLFLFASC
jgi:hypothetical protein